MPGFTLLELLVVISIVGLLAALLLPALARSRIQARQIRCLSNQRQLGLVVHLYTQDHADILPPSTDYSAPLDSPERIWPGRLASIAESPQVFLCPEARGAAFANRWEHRGLPPIGYTTATAYDPASREGFPQPARLSLLASPIRTPLFGDTAAGPTSERYRGYVFDPYNGPDHPEQPELGLPLVSDRDLVRELSGLPPSRLKPLLARHGPGRLNLILGDNHAESLPLARLTNWNSGAAWLWRFRAPPPT